MRRALWRVEARENALLDSRRDGSATENLPLHGSIDNILA